MTDHPGEQFPPAVDPDVEPGADPRTDEEREPDYDSEPGSSGNWVNPTQQARPHTDPLLAGFTMYGETPTPEPASSYEPVSSYEADAAEPEPVSSYGAEAADPEPVSSYDAAPADEFLDPEDTEQAFEASLEAPTEVDEAAASYEDVPAAADEPVAEASYEELRGAADEPVDGGAYEGPAAAADEVDAFGDDQVEAFGEAAEVAEPVRVVPSPAAFARPAPPIAAARAEAPAGAGGSEYGRGVDEEAAHPLVEETMARLDELRERPVGEHAEVYADLHERLQSALVEADAEHGDRG